MKRPCIELEGNPAAHPAMGQAAQCDPWCATITKERQHTGHIGKKERTSEGQQARREKQNSKKKDSPLRTQTS